MIWVVNIQKQFLANPNALISPSLEVTAGFNHDWDMCCTRQAKLEAKMEPEEEILDVKLEEESDEESEEETLDDDEKLEEAEMKVPYSEESCIMKSNMVVSKVLNNNQNAKKQVNPKHDLKTEKHIRIRVRLSSPRSLHVFCSLVFHVFPTCFTF